MMRRIQVGIEGISPILFNRLTEEQQQSIATRKTGGVQSIATHREQAVNKLYKDDIGIYLPAQNLKRCLMAGSQKASLKYGKKALHPFIEALVFIEEQRIYFNKKEQDFIDERVGRVPPKTGARVILYRPGLNAGWQLNFQIAIVDDRLSIENINLALQEAGILAGLCDYRPEFGRFKVINWTEILPFKEHDVKEE